MWTSGLLGPSGQLRKGTGLVFHSTVILTLVKPQLLARGDAILHRVLDAKCHFSLGFPRLDTDASDVQLPRGAAGLGQVAAKLIPQVVPGTGYSLPGKSDLEEITQALLSVDQEGVCGIQLNLLHDFQGQVLGVCVATIQGNVEVGLDVPAVLVRKHVNFQLIMVNSERHARPGF